jgi:uncharacterized protein (DUF2267 family)
MPETQRVGTESQSTDDMLEELRSELPPKVKPEDAVSAVMCTFSQHVSGTEARRLFDALPEGAKPLLDRCMSHRDDAAEQFGRDQLVVRVAGHLELSLADAEDVIAAVLTAISSRLPGRDIEGVARELPVELRELWCVQRSV